MTWGRGIYNCASIPALNTYADAKAHFESVAPIRGRANPDYQKPLGKNRRFTWYRIMRRETSRLVESNPLGEFVTTYGAQLYGDAIPNKPLTVEFHHDGNIDINLAYACPTTKNFVTFVLNGYGYVESLGGKWYWINRADNSQFPLEFVRRWGESTLNQFVVDGQRLVPKHTKPEVKYSVSRKGMNAIRKKYKPFLEYAHNALLISNVYERLEVAEASHGLNSMTELQTRSKYASEERQTMAKANRDNLFSTIEKSIADNDLGLQYELLTVLACNAGRYSYREQKYLCDPKEFDNYFTCLIKTHHRDEVFKTEEMPVGKAFFDRNAVYFK